MPEETSRDLIPDKVEAARRKQAEKKAKKASTAATAIAEDEHAE
jgi:hypothetical protein